MSKRIKARLSVFLMCVLAVFSVMCIRSDAFDTYTVSGTVGIDTTSNYLYLNTPQGKMTIAIDPETDLSGCKMLLPDKEVTVECHRGADACLHASKIYETVAVVDSSTSATVYGIVTSKTTEDVIFLSTTEGTMQIKVDSTTDFTGCQLVAIGKAVYIKVARGSDACLHAVTVSDGDPSNSVPDTIVVGGVEMPNVRGTVTAETTTSLLYFSTSYGTMIVKYDSNTDFSGCLTLIPGQSIAVALYRGNDAYMHAAKVTNLGNSNYNDAGAYTTTASFTGTVSASSTLNTLYLVTSDGTMLIKLDATTALSGLPLIVGRTVTVTCGYGADAAWHAMSIN
ncbi:hypothetical protein [Butyrivibrio sp. TB]|uniref:hypothetical protein n=1 Tax=Butyrivibrio sp. TB TaxID=1520809 RepID=UPI0008B2F758|nr:hypothetical protein [Butyrivibrio sp. TB]SEQ35990.1 hypothetical protein SAMN02910382_02754 [Butyrivibrio sp. TB]